jgi:hypothetical protein
LTVADELLKIEEFEPQTIVRETGQPYRMPDVGKAPLRRAID